MDEISFAQCWRRLQRFSANGAFTQKVKVPFAPKPVFIDRNRFFTSYPWIQVSNLLHPFSLFQGVVTQPERLL
jgi:hypothetical protein